MKMANSNINSKIALDSKTIINVSEEVGFSDIINSELGKPPRNNNEPPTMSYEAISSRQCVKY